MHTHAIYSDGQSKSQDSKSTEIEFWKSLDVTLKYTTFITVKHIQLNVF